MGVYKLIIGEAKLTRERMKNLRRTELGQYWVGNGLTQVFGKATWLSLPTHASQNLGSGQRPAALDCYSQPYIYYL
jgi:hypothetical protein